jgi:hypothetical protein
MKNDLSLPILEEKISPDVRKAFMGNFRNANEAVNELIDNCMADRMSRRQLDVQIELKRRELVITNQNGYGMTPEEAQGFLTWGYTAGRGLSRWGVGGKAAIGYLGTGFILQFKSFSSPDAYQIEDYDWERREEANHLATYVAKRVRVPVGEHEGFVGLTIIGLKMKIDEKKLREHIANIYRRVLMKGDAALKIGTHRVEPLDIPVYDAFSAEDFHETTPFSKVFEGWIGRLRADSPKGGPIKSGIRCCAAGRLITQSEYFGHHTPSYKASLGSLIGEIEIEFVPMGLKKTEFNTESKEWKYVHDMMHKKLEPHIKNLLKVPEKVRISQREWDRLDKAKDLIEKAFARLDMQEKLFQWAGKGRKKPEPGEIKISDREKRQRAIPNGFHREPNGDIVADAVSAGQPLPLVPEGWVYRDDRYGAIKHKYTPRTFPPKEARGKLQRLSIIPWNLRAMSGDIRSELQDLANEKSELRINVKYPLYQETKGAIWYLVETAALEMAKLTVNGNATADEYMTEVNDIVLAACEVAATEET